jgi:hypothetical protein
MVVVVVVLVLVAVLVLVLQSGTGTMTGSLNSFVGSLGHLAAEALSLLRLIYMLTHRWRAGGSREEQPGS